MTMILKTCRYEARSTTTNPSSVAINLTTADYRITTSATAVTCRLPALGPQLTPAEFTEFTLVTTAFAAVDRILKTQISG